MRWFVLAMSPADCKIRSQRHPLADLRCGHGRAWGHSAIRVPCRGLYDGHCLHACNATDGCEWHVHRFMMIHDDSWMYELMNHKHISKLMKYWKTLDTFLEDTNEIGVIWANSVELACSNGWTACRWAPATRLHIRNALAPFTSFHHSMA